MHRHYIHFDRIMDNDFMNKTIYAIPADIISKFKNTVSVGIFNEWLHWMKNSYGENVYSVEGIPVEQQIGYDIIKVSRSDRACISA